VARQHQLRRRASELGSAQMQKTKQNNSTQGFRDQMKDVVKRSPAWNGQPTSAQGTMFVFVAGIDREADFQTTTLLEAEYDDMTLTHNAASYAQRCCTSYELNSPVMLKIPLSAFNTNSRQNIIF